MRVLDYLEPSKQKTLWKKLKNDAVIPVLDDATYKQMPQILKELRTRIKRQDYHPNQLLGFLGYCKNNGATRFVPVMTVEDFAVYYACTGSLQDKPCFNIDGVFGAWRMSGNYERVDTGELVGDYAFDGTLSTKEWIKNWTSFTD